MSKAIRYYKGKGPGDPGARRLFGVLATLLLFGMAGLVQAQTVLQQMSYTPIEGGGGQLTLGFSAVPAEPLSFTTENPSRIALDFADTTSGLTDRTIQVGSGLTQSVTAVEARDRTRVVINLAQAAGYETRIDGNQVIVTVRPDAAVMSSEATTVAAVSKTHRRTVTDIDFRRGPAGEGKVMISLSDPKTVVDVRERPGQVIIEFQRTQIPEHLLRRLDVVDFATPVQRIDASVEDTKGRVVVAVGGEYETSAYQSDNAFVLEARVKEKPVREEDEFPYKGERLSLNFQDIEVRSVLQLIADFTGLNMVVSDSVGGNITLRLKNVPWDQALEIILRTKGLGQRAEGNVIYIAPHTEIAQRFQEQQQAEELAPLRTELMQVNYAKATDLAGLLKSGENRVLSERGSVTVDQRTNTLIVTDTAEKLADAQKLIERLDLPVRQVLIEARIVVANDSFGRELGVRFGVSSVKRNGRQGVYTVTGSGEGADAMVGEAIDNLQNTGQPFPVSPATHANRLGVNMPASVLQAAHPAGRLAMAILGKDILVDLELSALQAEGRGEVISNPRVVTGNQGKAVIKQGLEIPYQEATSSGATNVEFKEAVLSLEVTPQITPDDRIMMDLNIKKDRPDFTRSVLGVPPIETREVSSSVLVNNGETVVLGGIYEETTQNQLTKVPLLGDIPLFGNLFKSRMNNNERNELLIFVTPKIFSDSIEIR